MKQIMKQRTRQRRTYDDVTEVSSEHETSDKVTQDALDVVREINKLI